jgi:iron complex outermembrane receptor protein
MVLVGNYTYQRSIHLFSALLLFPVLATAQAVSSASQSSSDSQSGAGLEEIVVTAQKRSENLQKVPIDIAVVNEAQMESSGVTGVMDLKMLMPGVQVFSSAGSGLPFIRGVGSAAIGPGIENPIATYVDGVYINDTIGTLINFNDLDIDQIEVLKGPQGTLYGRNATGGLIQVFTKDPVQQFGGSAEVSYGNYQTTTERLYITGGVTNDLAANFGLQATNMGEGFGTNLYNGRQVYQIKGAYDARSKWLYTPSDTTQIRLSLDYASTDDSMVTQSVPPGFSPAPGLATPRASSNPYDIDENVQPYKLAKSYGGSIKVDQDLGRLKLVSISAVRNLNYNLTVDYDYTPTPAEDLIVRERDIQETQEFQLLSPVDSAVKWVLGTYYLHSTGSWNPFIIELGGLAAPPGIDSINGVSIQDTDSISAFGQATFKLSDRLHATAGLRLTNETKTLRYAEENFVLDNGGAANIFGPLSGELVARRPTWRTDLDYDVTESMLAYVSYDRGFKSGGYNPAGANLPAFHPETLDAYETGLKTTFLDDRVRMNLALFYYNYENVQVQRSVEGSIGIYNAPGGAKIYGSDGELEARVTRDLDVTLGYQVLPHAAYGDFPAGVTTTLQPNGTYSVGTGNVTGNRMVLSPRSNASAGAHYTLPYDRYGEIKFNVAYYYNSGFFEDVDNAIRQRAYSLLNASANWTAVSSGWSASLWAKNITNSRVQDVNEVEPEFGVGVLRITWGPPVTFGITVGKTF